MKWDGLDCFSASSMLWPVAIERGMQIEKMRRKEIYNEILHKIVAAKAICVWGLGRYFQEDFFQNSWDEILMPKYYTDMNITEEMRRRLQGKCVEVRTIINSIDKDGLLVIIYVKNSEDIEKILEEHGVQYIKIKDIYELVEIDI